MKTVASELFSYTSAVSDKLEFLEARSREMEESIRYAGSLQRSVLPNESLFKEAFNDAFVLFQPKHIVSGDFYWIFTHGANVYFAVGDCTGHGVPGAMLNIAGNSILKQIIRREGVSDPSDIISLLNDELVSLFNDNLTEGKTLDGMDIVFCKFNLEAMEGQFCGAGRPLVRLRNGELKEFKKGQFAVGYELFGEKQFETVSFKLEAGDQFYLFSDGYTDQFGGEKVKKFNRKRLRSLLKSITDMPMKQQKKELKMTLRNWMGVNEQVDDVCMLGVKV